MQQSTPTTPKAEVPAIGTKSTELSSSAGVGQRLKLSTDTPDGAGFFIDQADRDRAKLEAAA